MPPFIAPHNPFVRRRVTRAAILALLLSLPPSPIAAGGDVERGRNLFALAGGCGCHTGPDGAIGAGGGEVPTPFGRFYGTNITPDPETGIGRWTDAQVIAAIREGMLPDGAAESPAMPYYRYAGMSDGDLADLIAYVRALAPVRRENRPHEITLPLARLAYRMWRLLFVRPVPPTAVAPAAGAERGRYLVDHVAICGDCHTPRGRLGVSDDTLYLAGADSGPGGVSVPNITPHATGIAGWDAGDIVSLLKLGMLPDFDNVQGLMAEVIDGKAGAPGYKNATNADLEAIAAYLLTVTPIGHERADRE
jgi:mono/diheme cytochrome c family protein